MIKKPDIYQIKIKLSAITPAIWRRLMVPNDLFLHDLHKVIQTTMGWENAHLHQFKKNNRVLGFANDEPELSDRFIDYTSIRLMDILKNLGDSMEYIYDFGDYWQHEIILEDIHLPDKEIYYPICIEGKRNCPPEDCGGPSGYHEVIKAFNHPGLPNREDILNWIEEDWNPEEFDLDYTNSLLLEDDFGCLPLIE